ncbi:hypothetical protein ccbrp13_58040 [Ktedonobacteria bacterium brp13]|nr:hypothetical protein ccbrp13_58040 [Ktedonobacteria bacterium brp13]
MPLSFSRGEPHILLMARKDSEKDSERPHYYSQFWLDVAAGRRVIGAPKPEDGEVVEPEVAEPAASRRGYTAETTAPSAIVHPVVEPVEEPAEYVEPDTTAYSDLDNVDYSTESEEEGAFEIPDVDLEVADEAEEAESAEDEEFYEEESEEEEEEDDEMNWGRGRKKKSPRVTKPVVKKPGKRDTRRSY